MRGEVAAAFEMLNAALKDKDKLDDRLRRAEAELAAERAQRQAAEEAAARLRQELEQARRERTVGCRGLRCLAAALRTIGRRMLCRC